MNRNTSIASFLTLIVLAIPAAASAEPTISWINPPEEITIPAPKDGNRFLKVKISGDRTGEVYLAAADAHAESNRLYSDPLGESEYTFDMSESSVRSFARNADLSKGLRAYARLQNGKTISTGVIRVKFSPKFKQINLKCDPIRVVQRGYVNLPGSHGQLQLYISDITKGSTVALIVSDDGDDYTSGIPMRAGESDTFEVREGEEYTIVCEALYDSFMGTDYGVFRVYKTVDWDPYQIERLIRFIEVSDASFVAGKEKKTGPEFAKMLRAKIKEAKTDKLEFAKFMKEALTALDGKTPCEVHTKDGKKEELANWHDAMCKAALKKHNKATSKPSK
ncbi:MAG: hypothetical protein IPK83_21650 [Planctomycetes bacterium]|nr:hypothetical protein [Planctomycetota bacterium]